MKLIAALVALVLQGATPASEQQDIYAIYSLMITSRMTPQRVVSDEIYLIDESTVTNSGGPACVKAPAEDTAVLAEILTEYNRRNRVSVTLARQFNLPKPYELLDRARAAGFLKDALDATPQFLPRGVARPVNQNPLYPKAKQVFRFSEVYFDKTRTWALAWVAVYETTVDYMGSWRPYKKSANGVWEENPSWTPCGRAVIR